MQKRKPQCSNNLQQTSRHTSHKVKEKGSLRRNKCLGYGHITYDCPNRRYINLAKLSLKDQQKDDPFYQRQLGLIHYMTSVAKYEKRERYTV